MLTSVTIVFDQMQLLGVLMGNYTSNCFDFGANRRYHRNLGSRSQESRAKLHAKSVRTDNYRHLYSRANAETAVYWILRLQWLLKNVHGAACLTDIRRGWHRVDEKVHRPTGSKGEIKRSVIAIYLECYRLNV